MSLPATLREPKPEHYKVVKLHQHGYTWKKIAQVMGYSERWCRELYRQATVLREQNLNEERQRAMADLELIFDHLEPALNGEALPEGYVKIDPQDLDMALAVMDRRIKLAGWEAPKRVQMQSVSTVQVNVDDVKSGGASGGASGGTSGSGEERARMSRLLTQLLHERGLDGQPPEPIMDVIDAEVIEPEVVEPEVVDKWEAAARYASNGHGDLEA
jgi:hypothetical protein